MASFLVTFAVLFQAMEEASLDALCPNTDDDLTRRLAELRGDTVPAPDWSGKQHQPPPLESPGVPQGLDDMQEVGTSLLSQISAEIIVFKANIHEVFYVKTDLNSFSPHMT